MKITINNFGPIESITFDMDKNFHLIYGKNSTGKSYSTYCLYCLIKNIKGKRVSRNYYYRRNFRDLHKDRLKSIFKRYKTNKDVRVEFVSFAKDYIQESIESQIMPGLKTSLRNTFSNLSTLKNAYTKKSYSIIFNFPGESTLSIESDKNGEPYFSEIILSEKWEFVEKNTISTKYCINLDGKKWVGAPTEEKFIEDYIFKLDKEINGIFKYFDAEIRDVYYLPASRSGLYQALSSFTPILAELTQNRFFLQNKKLELPSLSEPLSDYFLDISTIDATTENEQYKGLIENFEKNILEGKVRYDNETKKIKYQPYDMEFELDIAEVSSMVAELSPIVIFLKHILHHKYSTPPANNMYEVMFHSASSKKHQTRDVIFIEEPEAHLHPEVQVKLAEIFAELTNHNITIIMTSHSNYMFNKINNIILKQELKSNDLAVYQLIKGKKGSKCNPEMKVDKEGISDENFVEVSKQLYEERLESLED
ncbi:AAA family ATPase [Agrobacterium tumefaciens]|nr:AAA family ATPase [Agrobacterium tumefaciens]NTE17297.1 AAA family ATPase [Agrobacterium tumefaciens]